MGRLKSLIDDDQLQASPSRAEERFGSARDVARRAPVPNDADATGAKAADVAELSATAEVRTQSIYVGNLAWETEPVSLRRLFETIGPVKRVHVPRDVTQRHRSRGFGFVEMAYPEHAKKARTELDGRIVDGRAIDVQWARS